MCLSLGAPQPKPLAPPDDRPKLPSPLLFEDEPDQLLLLAEVEELLEKELFLGAADDDYDLVAVDDDFVVDLLPNKRENNPCLGFGFT